MKILIVEDEKHLAEAMVHILKKQQYSAHCVFNGEDGYDEASTGLYDVIILDIMLPKKNGLHLLKDLRHHGIKTPVLMLTAKGDISDRVLGLDSGADDYLPKPFDTDELLARVRALLRRQFDLPLKEDLAFGDISLNRESAKLICGTNSIKLTLKEFEVIEFLILRKHMIVPKELLIEKLWGLDSEAEDNHVEVYISFLRKKLLHLASKVKIVTTRGIGYALEENEDV